MITSSSLAAEARATSPGPPVSTVAGREASGEHLGGRGRPQRLRRRTDRVGGAWLPLALVALVLLVAFAAVTIGGTVTPAQTLSSIAGHLGLPVAPLSRLTDSIVWELRLPRVLLAAIAGAGLACCGLVLQAVTRNALAEPYLLGISSGASTGAVVVLVLGLGGGAISLAGGALVGGLAAFALVFGLMGGRSAGAGRIVLVGVVVGQFCSAVTSLILMAWGDADSTRGLTYWLLGSLAAARWSSVLLCAVVVGIVIIVLQSRASSLDAFAFGRDAAASLGVDVGTTRIVVLVCAALATAAIVSSVGAIGFVGLIVPHAARLLVGGAHRVLVPTSALAGAVFLMLADAVGRLLFAPQQIPAGVITALLGVPVFIMILSRRERA
ncbi:FecCD family ABC transporter permease [Plantibacter sp. Mn2098]|uniref:FecCD family ABC transporter permease n=1 Tax=Plantibacter sp. Mn2098 TaxID=3395266 RepID=UPI003BDB8678